MNFKFILFLPLLLMPLACTRSGMEAVQMATAELPITALDTPVVQPTHSQGGIIRNLQEASRGVVRIFTQGSYQYPESGKYEVTGSGSGFIIDPSGIAITNNHVVAGAGLIDVYFSGDPNPYRARLLGTSECADLAMIDIEGQGYAYFEWYSDPIGLGQEVYSLGYPLGDAQFSQNAGTVSRRAAPGETSWSQVGSVIEHNARVQAGSSGGPLVTEEGKVVGVNYAAQEESGLYYTISYNEAKPFLADLRRGRDVLSIGINGEAFVLEDDYSGIWVYSVKSGSRADRAGIRGGDILTSMEGIPLASKGTMAEYCDILGGHDPEDTLNMTALRWKTGETLEGQINGRALDLAGSAAGGAGGLASSINGNPYYQEEFDGDVSQWQWFLMSGDDNDFNVYQKDGRLVFELTNKNIWGYLD